MKPFPLILFGILIGLVTLGIISGDRTNTDVLPLQPFDFSQGQEQQALTEATLIVGEKTYVLSLPEGSSVYDLMVKAQESSSFTFRGQEFPGLGFFIQEINGLEQSPRLGKYWIYYINGKKAEVGISAYTVNNHDIILWKYEDEE
ncbi:MAG: DUF4430 domain-containing protein [Candidatus Wildermuthbacteria bacterium]|nr:DUF4430 domain-containing protein [Candidatus Wildermuthbacteria bacterium]